MHINAPAEQTVRSALKCRRSWGQIGDDPEQCTANWHSSSERHWWPEGKYWHVDWQQEPDDWILNLNCFENNSCVNNSNRLERIRTGEQTAPSANLQSDVQQLWSVPPSSQISPMEKIPSHLLETIFDSDKHFGFIRDNRSVYCLNWIQSIALLFLQNSRIFAYAIVSREQDE